MNDAMMKVLTFFTYIAVSLSCYGVPEQDTRRFQYIGTRQGLPDGKITGLMTDHRGALWIGTDVGLAQYDGYEVVTVTNQAVSDIYEDSDDNLWIRSGELVLRYLRHEHRMDTDTEAFFESVGIDNTPKELVFTDSRRRLWVLTHRSLYCYDFSSRRLHTMTSTLPQRKNRANLSAAEDSMNIYIGGCGDRLWQVDKRSGRITITTIPAALRNNRPCIYADHSGTLWAYSTLSEQLYRRIFIGGGEKWQSVQLPPSDGKTPSSLSANAIHQIADDGRGHLWIATDHRGLFCYDISRGLFTGRFVADGSRGSIAENNINTIAADRHGTIWLGHYKQGISYSSPAFSMFSRFATACGDVSALFSDRSGTVWIGTDGDGLYRSQSDGVPERTSLQNMVIASIIQDRRDRIWVGTYNSGLYCLDTGGRVIRRYSTADGSLPTDMSWKISEDAAGNIWVSSAFHPLLRLDPATGRYTYSKSTTDSEVYGLSMAQDDAGHLFVGTSYGLYVADTHTGNGSYAFGNRTGNRPFFSQQAIALCHDSRDILWMGHYDGLSAWDLKTDSLWIFTTCERGICNNLVKSIQEDSRGNIWVSTAGGISCISVTDRARGDFSVLNFKSIASEASNYFNQNSSTLSSDSTVLFGCVRGYVSVSSSRQRRAASHPQVFFSSVTVGGQPFDDSADRLNLSYNDHTIRLSLMTDNPGNASEMRYAYTMGSDNEWVYISSPVISFASIASGSYLLRVKACNGDGVWSAERRMTISVSPPLWRSPLMLGLYLLILAGMVCLFVMHSRRRNRRRIDHERRRMEQDKNVRLAEMKLRFFTNVSHDLRTPLTLIISPLQTLLREALPDTVTRRLQIMEKNARLLQEQISTLLDFRRLDVGAECLKVRAGDIVGFVSECCDRFSSYAADRNINFTFSSTVDSFHTEFDHDKIHKIMYNLLSNAFKYTPDGSAIAVSLSYHDGSMSLSVTDSGPGVADKDKQLIFERFYQSDSGDGDNSSGTAHLTGSGIGLHIVSEYVRLMSGTVAVTDAAGGGAVFTLRIPLVPVKTCCDTADEPVETDGDVFTVLVVDDNQDMCEFISTSLSDRYRVLTAADGAEALTVLGREAVSLVVSDVMMPVMDGLELCRRIKTDLQLSHIPVILLTARTAENSVMEGYETGADDYLTKPFNIDMLRLRISKFIELARISHSRFRQKTDIKPEEITTTPLDEQFLKQAISIVEANIGDSDFSVEALGQALAMNRVALWKKLQAITGKGPADFIRSIRVKRGRKLLDEGRMNISEIAYLVGYNTVKRFTENFKAEFGMTPSEYKKRVKSDGLTSASSAQ